MTTGKTELEGLAQSQPCGEASSDEEVFAGQQAAPSAADDANALLKIITTRASDFSRKAADDLYAHLLAATQDYLIDNAHFNIGETIASAQRQARHDREAWGKSEARSAMLTGALKELWLAATCGTDAARLAALSAAGDVLARVGALASQPNTPADRQGQVPEGDSDVS